VIWFHAVSVGEVHLLVPLVSQFQKRNPLCRVVISSTTDTGLAEARARFASHTVIPFPFDFSWAVVRCIRVLKPAVLVLVEGELWPNLLRSSNQHDIPVVVVNGRLSPKSYSRYKRVARIARELLFRHIHRFAVQDESYAHRYRQLGIPPEKIIVTGSVKYDGASGVGDGAKADALKTWLGWEGRFPILVAGSTHSPEETYILRAFAILKTKLPDLKLILVPRHPDRFAEVEVILKNQGVAFAKRSQDASACEQDIVLLDTIGELGAAWSLATVGYVGGTLDGHRGGQSMIEPAAYGVPTVFGPHVWNFRDAVNRLLEVQGAVMIQSEKDLAPSLLDLLTNNARREAMGIAARELVKRQQGATARTIDVLEVANNTNHAAKSAA
jgi:3-deoxy-D-manno-octulosonic-acid transferase